ncbi:DNA polymerase II large subunit [Candidatus Micrarchaeota archaeon]|nr:DNA polymerase II large subunit [Candidatus Micrarchaeota archaeon]
MNSSEYYELLREGLKNAYAIAQQARAQGFDPTPEVEVKIAKDVAARVEGIVGPPGIAEVIRTLESSGMSREDISFEVARKLAAGEIIKGTKEQLIEQAVRTGLGILTEGVLVAPTEGIAKVRIKKNPDGSDYVAVYYAGPIRSAGGTAAALSLVLADIARRVCDVGDYRPTETQLMRINEEILVYENRCVHLQYLPSEEHIKIIAQHCPVCVDGEPTEDVEVSAYRDVPGIETNRVRSGVALVICDGLALKAAKLLKITKKLKLNWDWLEKVIKIKKTEDRIEIKPDSSYLEGLVAGRPVFSHASAKGGFRLRYGRSKTNGLMARNIHPAIMVLLDNFLAYGTHMKVERPGKGCVVAAHEGIEPPAVKLRSGRVLKVRTLEEAYAIKSEVEEILFLGDMLTTYGDFLKSNHPLIPSGYCEEWWLKEIEAKGLFAPVQKDAATLIEFSKMHNVPLHPDFTYHWHDLSIEQIRALADWLKTGKLDLEDGSIRQLRLPLPGAKRALEELLVEHRVIENFVVLSPDDSLVLLSSFGALTINDSKFDSKLDFSKSDSLLSAWPAEKPALEFINNFIITKAKAPTYIGGRMGRPEKAKERKMDGSPHVLFPTGSFKNRSILKHYRTLKTVEGEKTINIEVARLRCTKCNKLCFYRRCDVCMMRTELERMCTKCGRSVPFEMHCDVKTVTYDRRPVDIVNIIEDLRSKFGALPEDIKGVKGLSNPSRMPENLKKGFLRSRHDVYVFRDGTSRFDATDIPLTHFTPNEISLNLDQARSLGYLKDYLGNPLENGNQLVSLHHQDIILSESGVQYFLRVAAFIDDMLINIYGMKPFYNIKSRDELIGHLFVGLSPHTSAGVLCRVIGFTRANVGYGHPYYHTAKRRNCFYPETKIVITEGKNKITGTLKEITEKLLKEHSTKIKILDPSTTKIPIDTDWFIASIDSKSKKIVQRKINCFMKTKSPEYWIKITTTAKKELIVTPDHNILCIENSELSAVDADKAKIGMIVPLHDGNGGYSEDKIVKIEKLNKKESAYCLDIETESNDLVEKNILLENGIFCIRCDGDEDCIMLLLDCLINFSRDFLDERRGGTMDTPLVLSIEINPKEVDDEAHNIEFVSQYPLEFYQAAERIVPPSDVKIKTVKDVLGTEEQYTLPLTHPGGSIDVGVIRTAYVELDSVPEKIDIQFALQDRLRPVDRKDAAERLILSHFIPDLYGNLRSFSRQTFRCVSCNTIFRRVPLAGKCNRCGGNLLLTINKGGIQKYLSISEDIVKRYELPMYLKQRLELVEKEIKSIFEDDKIKQTGLADFL